MNEKNIYLSTHDHRLMQQLLTALPGKSETIARLHREVARAIVLDATAVPTTAVGLNSRVQLVDLDTKERDEYVVTLPHAADPEQRKISVLAPVGTALLGYCEGDQIEWPTPGGIRRLKLLHVTREPVPVSAGQA